MYFSCQHFNFFFFLIFSFKWIISILSSWHYLYFVFCLCGNTFSVFYELVFFSMMSEWNESCTESISCIQVNGSIIKDQIGVLSVSVSQPAPQGHLVANQGTAWPCCEGCCHHAGGSLVLTDSSRHCFLSFFFSFLNMFFVPQPHDDIKDPLLREHTSWIWFILKFTVSILIS